MIALRLVHLIESHSEQLAESLIKKLERSSRAAELKRVPAHEIRERTHEVYRNLSDWILTKTEDDIERVYMPLGRRRAEQGVTLSALCWALMMTEENSGIFWSLKACARSRWRSWAGSSCCGCSIRFLTRRSTLPRWDTRVTEKEADEKTCSHLVV